jgi:hypothetical protein
LNFTVNEAANTAEANISDLGSVSDLNREYYRLQICREMA